jgi:hypothetical protein
LVPQRGVELPLLVLPPSSHAEAAALYGHSLVEPAIEKYQSQYRKEIYEERNSSLKQATWMIVQINLVRKMDS